MRAWLVPPMVVPAFFTVVIFVHALNVMYAP
jgi:hypothetical protein